ncbi:MAG TPA: hypothetical protein ENJ29_02385 [Bacteroidetes bacterium]|nr:hypothetical protein [Bacteroidota bacterium]
MNSANISIRYLGPDKKVVRAGFHKTSNLKKAFAEFELFFEEKLKQGYTHWIMDLQGLAFPTSSMIAFFISATVRTRSHGGEVTLINASESARNNFVTFSPLTFLSIENDERQVLRDFDVELGTPSHHENTTILDGVDIAEPPEVDVFSEIVQDDPAPAADKNHPQEDEVAPLPNIATRDTRAHSSEKRQYRFETESSPSNLYAMCNFVVEHAAHAGISEKHISKIKISIYEACLNVIEHAYHSRPGNPIELRVAYDSSQFKVEILDHGLSFNERKRREYDVEAAMENRQTGGFGMHIIERAMDEIDYVSDPVNGNCLTLIKHLPA